MDIYIARTTIDDIEKFILIEPLPDLAWTFIDTETTGWINLLMTNEDETGYNRILELPLDNQITSSATNYPEIPSGVDIQRDVIYTLHNQIDSAIYNYINSFTGINADGNLITERNSPCTIYPVDEFINKTAIPSSIDEMHISGLIMDLSMFEGSYENQHIILIYNILTDAVIECTTLKQMLDLCRNNNYIYAGHTILDELTENLVSDGTEYLKMIAHGLLN